MKQPSPIRQASLLLGMVSAVFIGHLARGEDSPAKPKRLEFPAFDAARRVAGELVSADLIHRTGQFRTSETGELVDFTMLAYASVKCQNAEADLRDVPLGLPLQFFLIPDENGHFSRLALLQDQLTFEQKHVATETQQRASDAQQQKFNDFTKARGLPGWIEKTEGNKLTITLFSGDPARFQASWKNELVAGKEVRACVANDELRTWNPPVDNEGGSILEVQNVPVTGYGCSGVRLVMSVGNMLEGFRKGRCVRIFGAGWKVLDPPYGESLMGYGFARMRNLELVENVAKEFPEQFPFRTDFANSHLPWYQLKSGVVPPQFSEHHVLGELVKIDASLRTGQFRADRTGEIVEFALTPDAQPKRLNADAKLEELPLEQRYRFHLYQDDHGAFTRCTFFCDEFTHLAQHAVTLRIESLQLEAETIAVAHQIPEVKDYNDDLQRPADIGRSLLRVNAQTRVWKGKAALALTDLKPGDALRINLTCEAPGHPAVCTDMWIQTGEELK